MEGENLTDRRGVRATMAGCLSLVVLLLLLPQSAFAQPQHGVWVDNLRAERMWAVIDIHHVGSMNISRDYSYSYSGYGNEELTHAFRVAAPESGAMTRVVDVFSVAPTTSGSHFYVDTIIGYEPPRSQDTGEDVQARLVGGEITQLGISHSSNSQLCAPAVTLCGAAGSQFELKRGVVHATTSTNTPMALASYDFSSAGEGTVRTGFIATSNSGNAHSSYSQRIEVSGKFGRVSYSANFNPS